MRHEQHYSENIQKKLLKLLLSYELDHVLCTRRICHVLLDRHVMLSLQARRDLHAPVFRFKIVNNLLDYARIAQILR